MKRSRESEEESGTAEYSEDVAIVPISKILNLDNEALQPQANETTIQCSLPGHTRGTSFFTYAEYEKHYNQVHSNRCCECGKNFPTSHILSLHIQEHHDALIEVRREKGGRTYACFVEACEDKFHTHIQREEHLICDHTYPEDYFFAVTKFGINNKRQSMLVEQRKEGRENNSQRKGSGCEGRKPKDHATKPTASGDTGDTGESKDVQMADADVLAERQQEIAQGKSMIKTSLVPKEVTSTKKAVESGARQPSVQLDAAVKDTEMEDLAGAMSSLKFVPRAVQLGPKQKPRR